MVHNSYFACLTEDCKLARNGKTIAIHIYAALFVIYKS